MSKLNTLVALTEHFDSETISVQPDHCLNGRFQAVGCTHCRDICPAAGAAADAISLDGDHKPIFDQAACLQCGLCLHQCPTSVFSQPDRWAQQLVETVAILPTGPIDLTCPQHPSPQVGFASQAIQIKRCLAALSAATLLEVASHGHELWLDDTHCPNCPLAEVQATFASTVAETNAWGQLLPTVKPIALRSQVPDSEPAGQRLVYRADRPPLSRRNFFSALRRLGKEGVSTIVAEELAEAPKPAGTMPVSERLPPFAPRQRMQLLRVIDRERHQAEEEDLPLLAKQAQTVLPVADIDIMADRCSACGLCARFCPTGALAFANNEGHFSLVFQARLCLGQACDICRLACPEDAVRTSPASSKTDLRNKKPHVLLRGDLTTCLQCGQHIAVRPADQALCFVCRSKNSQDLFFF